MPLQLQHTPHSDQVVFLGESRYFIQPSQTSLHCLVAPETTLYAPTFSSSETAQPVLTTIGIVIVGLKVWLKSGFKCVYDVAGQFFVPNSRKKSK
jgi:hypothetical protein